MVSWSTISILSCALSVLAVLGAPRGASAATDAAYVEELVRRASSQELWREVGWLRLGHYRSGLFGGHESEVDGQAFFLAKHGKTDPRAELEATLRAFFTPPPPNGASPRSGAPQRPHELCRFPARFMWLNQRLQFDARKVPWQACEEFAKFLAELQPQSLTLVFSAYFLNNPASAFGHTFLRVNKARQAGESRQALLDYGMDFSANVDTNNALVYAIKGLTGLFHGVYRRIPYYYKVREYNDYESRDLWEYELSLPPEQVMLVMAHIWELGETYFDYFYLSENCSYQILGALEVANPDLKLLEHVNWPALPVDTVRALYRNPGLVRQVHYRPSGRTQFKQRLSRLSGTEIDLVGRLLSDPNAQLPDALPMDRRVEILDAALDVADSKFSAELVKSEQQRDREASDIQQRLLERRASLLVESSDFEMPPPRQLTPHMGHDSRRLSLGPGYSLERGATHELQFRLALHDLADPSRGYPESAQIEFLPLRLRYFVEDPRLWLEELRLVRVTSVVPWTRFEKPLSWTVSVGWDRLYDSGCDGCLVTTGEVGGGLSFSVLDDGLMMYWLGVIEMAALAPLRGGILDWPLRLGAGPDSGLRLRFSEDLVGLLQGRLLLLPTQRPRMTWNARGTLRYQYVRNFAVGVEAGLEPDERRVGLTSLIYF